MSFDDESAFLSLNSNVYLSTFTPELNEICLRNDMSDIYDSNHVDGYHSHVAFPSTVSESLERTSNVQNGTLFFDYETVLLTLWFMMGLSLFLILFTSLTYLVTLNISLV